MISPGVFTKIFPRRHGKFISDTYSDFADMARKKLLGTLSPTEWANYLRNKDVPSLLPGDRGLTI
jgi:hypothetical protein